MQFCTAPGALHTGSILWYRGCNNFCTTLFEPASPPEKKTVSQIMFTKGLSNPVLFRDAYWINGQRIEVSGGQSL